MVINWFYLLDKVESRKDTKEPQKIFFRFSYRFIGFSFHSDERRVGYNSYTVVVGIFI